MNLTVLGPNSAGIIYYDRDAGGTLDIAYVSGIIRKCDTCYFYGTYTLFDNCPVAGSCFVTESEVCTICNMKIRDICVACATNYELIDG